jgi:hypothetical protein
MIGPKTILTTAALLAVCAAPASAAPYEELRSDGAAASGDVMPPPSSIAASAADEYQDLRSPDAKDASEGRGLYADAASGPYVLERGYGSPDAVDAARDLPPVQIPAPVVATGEPSGGFDWGDAGIGAAGMLALFSIAAGSALMLTGRKRRRVTVG